VSPRYSCYDAAPKHGNHARHVFACNRAAKVISYEADALKLEANGSKLQVDVVGLDLTALIDTRQVV